MTPPRENRQKFQFFSNNFLFFWRIKKRTTPSKSVNFCGFFDVYNLYITQKKNFFEKIFHFYLTYQRDNFEKILKIFFQARGLRTVAKDEEFRTLSCAGVLSRLLKYFFSYFDLKIPIYKAKIEKKFSGGMPEIIYTTYKPQNQSKTAPDIFRKSQKISGQSKKF